MLDNLKKKAAAAVDQHGDKISSGLDKAADAVDKKTGGKHRSHLDKGTGAVKGALDKLDGKNDDIPDDNSDGTPPAPPR